MKNLRRFKKTFIITIITLCLFSVIVTISWGINPSIVQNSVGFIVTPVQKLFSGTSSWVTEKIDFLKTLGSIASENDRLKKEVEELRIENSRLGQVDKENERLSALLEMGERYTEYPKVGANIIGYDPGNWYDIFIIDKGTKDGILKNMVVLGDGGLIGRVLEAGYNYSKIISIINDTSSVSAKNTRTDDLGFLEGDIFLKPQGKCKMEFIDSNSQALAGDEIVTSHLSNIYPSGITIGYVSEIIQNSNGTKTAVVQPNIDFKHIQTVLIITQLFEKELIDNPEATAGQ